MDTTLLPQDTGIVTSSNTTKHGMLYRRLCQTNPRLNVARVRTLRAMYLGGCTLLEDRQILESIFPKFTHEQDAVYEERKKRAYYENMFGLVLNQISAGLAQDPLRYALEADEKVTEDYWTELLSDCTVKSDDATTKRTLDQLARDTCVEAMISGWAWLQADLPKNEEVVPTLGKKPKIKPPKKEENEDDKEEEEEEESIPLFGSKSLKDQEDSGELRAYLIPWKTEQVTDWSEKLGKLNWVRTYQVEIDDSDPTRDREDRLHIWTIWYADRWERYEYMQTKNRQMPNENELIPMKDSGKHSFGRVPWTRMDLTDGLWVGDVISSLCKNYFNRSNGESFQWSQFYFQQLYEFLAPEVAGIDTMISEAQTDPARAQRKRAPGMVHVRGSEDRAEYVGPNMSGANVGREALIDVRDGIMRVTQQMALSQDSNGALLRRSANSKKQDAKATEILLSSIGKRIVVCANNALELLAAGRQEEEPPAKISGYENFDVTDTMLVLEQAVTAMSLNIPSATYQQQMFYQAAITHLGDPPPDVAKKILEEIKTVITQDQMVMVPAEDDSMFGEEEDPFAEEEEEEEEAPDIEEEEEDDNPFAKKKKEDKKGKKPPFLK